MYSFSLDREAGVQDLAKTLHEFGVVHIEGFLDRKDCDTLADEAMALLDESRPWVVHEDYGHGRSVWFYPSDMDRAGYPKVVEAFDRSVLHDLVHAHYGGHYLYADKIYVIYDPVGQQTIVQQLHYDKTQHLKVFIYLTDVEEGHGPFRCVPGSHQFVSSLQAENRARGVIPTDEEARVLPAEFEVRAVRVLGRRGTLIAFNSDVAHSATPPTSGPRLAIRSLNPGPLSPRRASQKPA